MEKHTEDQPSPSPHQDLKCDPRPRATIASGIVLTIAAWLICRLTVGAVWGPARNPFAFNPDLWTRWDSVNYLNIAIHGATLGRCDSPGFLQLPSLSPLEWCGTAGWLPGYPWLIEMLHWTGISRPDVALLVSWLAIATSIFLIWLGWGRELPKGRALVLLLLFGLFPGSVYNFALFPTSLALAATTGAVLAATRERFLSAAALMAVAGLCYPSAWFAAAGLAIALIIMAVPLGTTTIIHRALWGLAGLSSLLVLGIHDQLALGHANAFLLIDLQPGLQAQGIPGMDFFRLIFKQNTHEQILIGRFSGAVLAVQGVFAVALAGAAVVTGISWRRKVRNAVELYPASVGAIVVLFVIFVGASGGAWNRSVVLAAPCVVCLRRLPLPWLCAIVAAVGVTTALISRSFFNNTLV